MDILKKFRRDLHQIPEIGLSEFKTQSYILSVLKGMGYLPIPIFNTGVYVFIDFGQKETIMFRSDIDALPITENNDIDFKSTHPKYMHACGHDGHMAMLLGFADFLKDQESYQRNVLLLFQPAEESPGGALEIVKTGIMQKYHVSEVYGIHLFPNAPEGTIVTKAGPMMASISTIDISIHGVSAHVAMPKEGIDALYYGTLFYKEIIELLEASLKPSDYILKFGKMSSGTVRNIVSNCTTLEGTIRTFSDDIKNEIVTIIQTAKIKFEDLYNVIIDINIIDFYPAVINDLELFNCFKKIIEKDYSFTALEHPVMISEDFSFYQQVAKGLFIFLGTNNPKLGFIHRLHNDQFNFNEDVLKIGVEAYKKIMSQYN